MARIRTIKPEFWTDAKTGTLTETSKCLLLGLLNHADDYGVLEWSPVEWRAKILPYHSDTTPSTVQTCLIEELLPRGLVVLFSFTGDDGEPPRRYAFIKNFAKHQVINKPSRPLLAGWKIGETPRTYAERTRCEYQEFGDDGVTPMSEPPHTTTGALPSGKERKGKGEERKGEGVEVRAARAAPPKATRWPSDAIVPESWIEKATTARQRHNMPPIDLRLEATTFANYWASKSGGSATKNDWERTWINWSLKADDRRKSGQHGGRSQIDELRDIAAASRKVLDS